MSSRLSRYYCTYCAQYFRNWRQLSEHNDSTHFLCAKCPKKVFKDVERLVEHYRGSPSERHPNCPQCGKGFFGEQEMTTHLLSRIEHPRFSCAPCGIYEAYEREYQRHLHDSSIHPNCDLCELGLETVRDLQEHRYQLHADRVCSSCGLDCETASDLETHQALVHATPRPTVVLAASPSNPSIGPRRQTEDEDMYNFPTAWVDALVADEDREEWIFVPGRQATARIPDAGSRVRDESRVQMQPQLESRGSRTVGGAFSSSNFNQMSATRTRSVLRCRVCGTEPGVTPSVTFCGHIFCWRCVTRQAIIVGSCPVCERAIDPNCVIPLRLAE